MTFNAMNERYEEITVCGKPALFTSIRIKRDSVPAGLYAYDVRHDDECRGIPCEIAPLVWMLTPFTMRSGPSLALSPPTIFVSLPVRKSWRLFACSAANPCPCAA